MNVNLTDWDELASYFDKSTPPGMIYEDGKLLGFGFSKDDYADLIYLDKHGSWHCRGNWQLGAEDINLMRKIASDNGEGYQTWPR